MRHNSDQSLTRSGSSQVGPGPGQASGFPSHNPGQRYYCRLVTVTSHGTPSQNCYFGPKFGAVWASQGCLTLTPGYDGPVRPRRPAQCIVESLGFNRDPTQIRDLSHGPAPVDRRLLRDAGLVREQGRGSSDPVGGLQSRGCSCTSTVNLKPWLAAGVSWAQCTVTRPQ